jgi:hypothetical protein
MEADEQQAPLSAGKCVQRRLEEVFGDVIVERSLVLTHVVLVQSAPPLGEGPIQKFLRLAAQGALQHNRESALQFVLLPGHKDAIIVVTEDLPKCGNVAKQGTGGFHVLDQSPEFGQRVLHRRGCEQQHGRGAQKSAHPMRHQGFIGGLFIERIAAVALMEPGEDLVGFVDDHQIEGRSGTESGSPALAAGEFPADQIYAGGNKTSLFVLGLNGKQGGQLVLPLADQGFWNDQENPLKALGTTLRDDQTRFDGLAETHFVGEDATAIPKSPQGENNGIDLMGVGVDPGLPLRGRVALEIVGTPDPGDILGQYASVEPVQKSRRSTTKATL